jgi:endonuclease YncB( thermonuclease family)
MLCLSSFTTFGQTSPVPLNKPAYPVIEGRPRIIDGDTIAIDGTRIRLYGIDAPKLEQKCRDGWNAGQAAKDYLSHLIPRRARIVCTQRSIDKYNRVVALCTRDGMDISAIMVAEGMAWSDPMYSSRYLPEEREAKKLLKGIHSQGRRCKFP